MDISRVKQLRWATAVGLCLLIAACATGRDKEEKAAQADNASVQAVKNRFILGVQTRNVDEVISLLSDDFEHKHFGGKEQARMIMSEAVRQGFLDEVEIDLLKAQETTGEDGYAMIGPIGIVGLFGHVYVTLYFQQVDNGWFIHKIVADV